MNRLQFSLARMMLGIALTALACAAARFTWSFARWLLLPSLMVLVITGWAMLLSWGRGRITLAGFTLGGTAGWLLEMFAVILAGAGQGTYLPFVVCFSPFFLLSAVANSDPVTTMLFAVGPLLYSIYGAAVAGAARSRWGPTCFATILIFHHGLTAIALGFVFAGRGIRDSRLVIGSPEYWWAIATTLLFTGIHAITLLFLVVSWRRRFPVMFPFQT